MATAVAAVSVIVLILLAALGSGLAWFLLHRSGWQTPRQRAMREVLDAADALEARLRTARAEIQAVSSEHNQDPVGDALREMLRQRLWLRDYGRNASVEQLSVVRRSIDGARHQIDQQLHHIDKARTS